MNLFSGKHFVVLHHERPWWFKVTDHGPCHMISFHSAWHHLICFSQTVIWNKYINCQVSWKGWEGKPMECQWDQNSIMEDCVPGASCYQSWIHPYLDSHGTVVQVLYCEPDLPQLQFTYLYLISLFFSTMIFSTNILIAWKGWVVLVRSNHKGDIYHSLLQSEPVQFSP